MSQSKSEQYLKEIEKLLNRVEGRVKKLKAYTQVVNDNEKLRDENMRLRQFLGEGFDIASSALPTDQKASQLSSFFKRSLYHINSDVVDNER